MESSSGKKIKHFIKVRFFPKQDINYPYNVLSVRFLKPQLILANNIFKSLENQTNKNFELVFIMNPAYFDSPKYEFIFSTLKEATTLPLTFVEMSKLIPLIKDALDEYDFVIQSRMDFDDFVYKDAIADTQSKVDECDSILSYGYNKGYSYLDGELLPYYNLFDGIGHIGILQSIILKSLFGKNFPLFTPYLCGHHKVKLFLKNFLAKNGFEFSEKMFQQNVSVNASIYFKHEFSHFTLTHDKVNKTVATQKKNKLTSEDITKKQLEEEFGFNFELNSIK